MIAGFEMTEYEVDENAGSVELCAIITVPDSGPLPASFVLQASTRDLTAGMIQLTYHCLYQCIHVAIQCQLHFWTDKISVLVKTA